MKYIFLDESGDLGFGRSNYFVIAALCTKNPKPIYNCINRIKKSTTKKYHKTHELHFSESEHKLRRRVLECLNSKDMQISYLLLNKTSFMKNSHLISKLGTFKDSLFMFLISETLKEFEIRGNPNILIDKYLSKNEIDKFNQEFSEIILRKGHDVYIKRDIETEHVSSWENKGIQAADFIAGAVHVRFRDNNPNLYKIISPKVKYKIIL
ncbi:DUF3800 domain-containing protein [Methanobacterium paludis]|uniref:DUF3800 domain-containing protein n=1 Tax=Methanobacterium paludis (strain DSM 25820 / JCM 18151 / SWAN1) TaxID=868131 RepID=F6D6M4_METPW|nr:DUF3800 domain-containing protein [Methanobacterium paludis]AEG17737.1 hypothetical protein MSWAN_0703 [Methanobacterium paludis]